MKEYRDHYFLKAKRENYPARSVYKLEELDAKFHLLRKGQMVLDLGAAPGSWTLYASQHVGSGGRVVACDLHSLDIAIPENFSYYREDVFERSDEFEAILRAAAPFDLVLSDMAPRTTGQKSTDQARSYALAEAASLVAQQYLKQNGSFVAKIFMGADVPVLLTALRSVFATVKTFKPKSSRSESVETFIVGLLFCGQQSAQ